MIKREQLNASIRDIPIPDLMRDLPVNSKGFPVPFFVGRDPATKDWDFRVVHPETTIACIKKKLCWLCGKPMGRKLIFVVGPMCVVTGTSAEPPSHESCAEYAAMACPFLAQPRAKRNTVDLPEGHHNPAGVMVERNPGVTGLLETWSYKIFHDGQAQGNGILFRMGPFRSVRWFAQRRSATRDEVMESINSGLPLLFDQVEQEKTVLDREEARAELNVLISRVSNRWLPPVAP